MRPGFVALSIAFVFCACRPPVHVHLPERGASYSSDGHVAFVLATPHRRVPTSLGDEEATELWVANADGTDARRLVVGTASDSAERTLAVMSSPRFSPDGRRIYFLSRGWVTSDAVHAVDVATGREWFVAPGNSLAVVPRGPFAGCLLVAQHRYMPNDGGSYDWTWLLATDGKEISLAASDSAGEEKRLEAWMSGQVPEGAFRGAGTAAPGTRCD